MEKVMKEREQLHTDKLIPAVDQRRFLTFLMPYSRPLKGEWSALSKLTHDRHFK